MTNVIGMFETRAEAEAAIDRLGALGVGAESISVAMKEPGESGGPGLAEATGAHHLTEEGSAVGAVSGAAVGSLVGLLIAGATFALPGIGTFLIAGPLASALAGAGVGAASGGVLGALIGSGMPEPEARHYLAGVESGRVVLAAHVPEARAAEVRRAFEEEGARRTDAV